MAPPRPVDPDAGRAALAVVRAAAATGERPERVALRTATRWLLEELARRAPGHAVEVRVPPYAAVQAIPGPVHRRGTPSAVVEVDPETWIALATGGTTWERARAAGLVRASGERADLSPWLPLAPADEPG